LHRHHLLKHVIEGKIKKGGKMKKRHKQLLNKLTEKGRHWNLKVEAILNSHKKATCIKQNKRKLQKMRSQFGKRNFIPLYVLIGV
jgi:hypothetical protein